jgi:hypothetical protein
MRLEQGCGESFSPNAGTGIFWSEEFEQINELLTSVIVCLHFEKQRLETLFDLLSRTDTPTASDVCSDATRLGSLGNTGKKFECFIAAILAGKKLGQINDHIGVVWFDLKCLSKGCLVSLLSQDIDGTWFSRRDETIDELDDLFFWHRSNELINDLPT